VSWSLLSRKMYYRILHFNLDYREGWTMLCITF
jgi:hypothetical protein